jgi:hypothetical protein
MRMLSGVVLSALAIGVAAMAADAPQLADEIKLEGDYKGHLQDVVLAAERGAIYWAHTCNFLKTDLTGKVLKNIEVPGHHAGTALVEGKLYVAVCPMQSKTGGKTTPECRVNVYVYDANTLDFVTKHELEQNDRSGSIALLPSGEWLVGCLRGKGITESQVRTHRYAKDFTYLGPVVWDLGRKIKLGIETIHVYNGAAYLGINPNLLVKLDAELKEAEHFRSGGQMGWFICGDAMWTGKSKKNKGSGKWESALIKHPLPWSDEADAQSKLIERYMVTDASVRDSQMLEPLLDGTEGMVYADSAYRNQPLSDEQKERNRQKSKVQAQIEQVCQELANSSSTKSR